MLFGFGAFLPPGVRVTAITGADRSLKVDGVAPGPLDAIAYAETLVKSGGFPSAHMASFAPGTKDGGQFSHRGGAVTLVVRGALRARLRQLRERRHRAHPARRIAQRPLALRRLPPSAARVGADPRAELPGAARPLRVVRRGDRRSARRWSRPAAPRHSSLRSGRSLRRLPSRRRAAFVAVVIALGVALGEEGRAIMSEYAGEIAAAAATCCSGWSSRARPTCTSRTTRRRCSAATARSRPQPGLAPMTVAGPLARAGADDERGRSRAASSRSASWTRRSMCRASDASASTSAFERGHLYFSFRLVNETVLSIEDLGLPSVCDRLTQLPRGLVIVTGPTGSGKSTTLASMIDRINERDARHIVTVEDPDRVHPPQQDAASSSSARSASIRARSPTRCATCCGRIRT